MKLPYWLKVLLDQFKGRNIDPTIGYGFHDARQNVANQKHKFMDGDLGITNKNKSAYKPKTNGE